MKEKLTDKQIEFFSELSNLFKKHKAELIANEDEFSVKVADDYIDTKCWKLNPYVIKEYILK